MVPAGRADYRQLSRSIPALSPTIYAVPSMRGFRFGTVKMPAQPFFFPVWRKKSAGSGADGTPSGAAARLSRGLAGCLMASFDKARHENQNCRETSTIGRSRRSSRAFGPAPR